MKNNLHTQARSPNLTKSNLPNQRPILLSLWLLIFAVGALSLAISAIAIINLTNTGNLEKDPSKQTTVATQTPYQNQSNSSPNWLLTIVLLGSSVAITRAVYKRRHNLPKFSRRGLTRRQQRKLSLQEVQATTATETDTSTFINLEATPEPLITAPLILEAPPKIAVLPPEEDASSYPSGESLAEMMDIRKHLSLETILQDFKRPD